MSGLGRGGQAPLQRTPDPPGVSSNGYIYGYFGYTSYMDACLLAQEECKKGRVRGEDGSVSSQRVRCCHNCHVRDEHCFAHGLHHVPASKTIDS